VPTVPIAQAYVEQPGVAGKQYARIVDDGRAFEATVRLDNPGSFTLHPVTAAGHTDDSPRTNSIKVAPDAPPTVEIVEPRPSATTALAAGSKLDIVLRASDDHGLGLARVEVRSAPADQPSAEPAIETVATWDHFASDGTAAQLHHALTLDPAKYPPGQALALRAVVADRRQVDRPGLTLTPQEAATDWVAISTVDPKQKAAESLARLEDLRSAIARILQQQTQARVATVGVTKETTPDAAHKAAESVRTQQVAIQKATRDLADTAAPTDVEADTLMRRTLGKLAADDLIHAVEQAEALAQVSDVGKLSDPATVLTTTQDQVLTVLRALLNELRKENADLLTEMGKRPDTTLPPDVQDRLKALQDKLDEFLKQQKKIIEASEALAKKPVDDFTEDDKKALEALAAAEDDWAKFMKDTHSDLSKLPEQDFSNPSLLQELVQVETELKMAKDALTKKTADIAVPLEQLGAEMAKEMTTNIEKWLTDTPDRERWSQEEPLTDEMKEAPMAELPQELEDIVGELMEEEEDLFDEMEDVTSSWADSLDKGAGWDAMDGPISNMSARGVTGNRLPNSSEIGGRGGEGRSGKSSGEFVGDTAEGKGGRKTPTRLTPDAFVKGDIKDTSKDPTGGATGGGKSSGYGGEGLQGPLSNRPDNPLARLANRQAELRNKAEAVDLKFQVLRFHHTDLKSLIGQMAAVEQDLNAGLYRNALRRRDVMLDNLGQVKQYLSGEFVVRKDASANLPTEIQKEILGSMSEPSPPGWDDLNRRYFDRLSAGSSSSDNSSTPTPSP
jgi:hypothetical protein